MAIIVDKEQKRRNIALSCKALFIEKGINNLTISEIAKTAGVGKGTVYEYFSNKEEIVFEIVNILMNEHNIQKEEAIDRAKNTKEKIRVFLSFFYDEKELELRALYKDFISISLASKNPQMLDFNTACFNTYREWFSSIIEDGIQRAEIIPESSSLSHGLFSIAEGLFISTEITNTKSSIEQELDLFFTTLFKLIEVKS